MDGLHFSVADWCFLKKQNPIDYYRKLKENGFIRAETVAPARFSAARAAGMIILNTDAPGKMDGVNKLENHSWLLPQILESIHLAADNDIPHLIVFSGKRKGQEIDEGLNNCATGFTVLAAEAEKHGVVMVLEVINSIDIPDYLADNSTFGFRLARAVSSRAFKILYDIYHMQVMGENVAGDIEKNIDLIGHIHVSQVPGMISPVIPGPVDFGNVVARACAAGYSGCWGLEFRPRGDAMEELRQARDLLNTYQLSSADQV